MYKCPECGVYFDPPTSINEVLEMCVNREAPVYTKVDCPGKNCDFAVGVGGEPDVGHEGEDCIMIFGFDLVEGQNKIEAYGVGVRLSENGTPYKE